MKIAIATLFAPSNYGNALQMLSLQRYLTEQGHVVEILRHWLSSRCDEIRYYHNRLSSIKNIVRFVVDVISFGGAMSNFRRETKMSRWVECYYRLSSLSGADGEFPIDKLRYDCIVAGSDQIWNPKYSWPDFNLLGGIPSGIKKISYAASFGTDEKALFNKKRFIPPLAKFAAISVREASAKSIVEGLFGLKADLVCDPTLLHTQEEWRDLLHIPRVTETKDQYVIYLVTPDFRSKWRTVIRLANEARRPIHFFAFSSYAAQRISVRHPIDAIITSIKNIAKLVALRVHRVHLHMTATPEDFIKVLSESKGLFTDSFHGLMFATIFNKLCNVSVGTHPDRILMRARLQDFITQFANREMFTSEFSYSGLRKAMITPQLQQLIEFSKQWLAEVLA